MFPPLLKCLISNKQQRIYKLTEYGQNMTRIIRCFNGILKLDMKPGQMEFN